MSLQVAKGRSVARRIVATLGLATLCGAACAAEEAGCESTGFLMPVTIIDKRVIGALQINGKEVHAVIDDSVASSRITEAGAARLQLELHVLPAKAAGREGVRSAAVDFLKQKQTGVPKTELVVGGDDPGNGAEAVLGRDFLDAADTEYDFPHQMMRFVFAENTPVCAHADMAYWAPGRTESTWLELHAKPGESLPPLRADIFIAGHWTRAVFDFTAATMITRREARAIGVQDGTLVPDAPRRAGGREVPGWIAPIKSLQVGMEVGNNNLVSAVDTEIPDAAMVIGFEFFQVHRIYVSKRQHRMFFSIVGDHPVFPRQAAHPADGLGPDALLARADEESERGQWGMALADLDRACAAAPRNAAVFARRARMLWGLVDQHGALADDSTAIRLAPDDIDIRFHRATVLFNMDTSGDLRSLALRDMAFLDKRLPPDDDRRQSMAFMYDKYGLIAQELAQWNLWMPVHGADSAILGHRCWARVRLGIELAQAIEDCDRAIARDAGYPAPYSHRGWARLLQDDPKQALADFDRGAARMYPGIAWALYGRAVAHRRLGDVKAAQADLQAARAQDREIDTLVNTAGLPTASPKAR